MMFGYLMALSASFFQASKDMVSKNLSSVVHGSLSAFASFAFAIPFYLILLTCLYLLNLESFTFGSKFFFYTVLRSLTDVGAELLKMLALSCGEISLVTQFFALSPLFLAFISPLITSDPITFKLVFALCLITFSSLMVVHKPRGRQLEAKEKKAIMYALGAAFFFSLNSALDRLAVQEASATLSAFTMTLFSGIILLPVSFFVTRKQWFSQLHVNSKWFCLRGILEVCFMVFKMIALQYLQAPIVVIMQRFSIILTVIGGKILYGEHDFKKRLFASMFIVISGVLALM